ncbi:TonB-dependent receptor [Marinilabilia salmonicolor]|uniref:Outer membrane receptor protein involved in Fe transport n=1 Tax=Marinilabilia salmonicolor TaxID=989 RepID=A0A2T0XPZ3_9BACT|nr:TonB-dependent receptor [Marinilabilia salmonicolor]PRZ00977.1 outer membrane receptor protein involved in Fe transport [Marinilabilia salmonicolor]RCW31096.1 outer membrane receptor protein involved in Fe transport [Marinilabilia salmonicolor]
MKITQLLIFLLIFGLTVSAQDNIHINGRVVNESGEPLELVNIIIQGSSTGTTTAANGSFEITVPPGFTGALQFSHLEYLPKELPIKSIESGESPLMVILEKRIREVGEVEVTARSETDQSSQRLNPDLTLQLPSAAGYGIEGVVKSQMGVSSNNELSSQYRVRGGNFDENLVYLNGFKLHRPQLVRSGQQEGLSIVNPDLVESVYFSSGGFGVDYGDKMSSVLDVRYKKPDSIAAGANINMMGMSAHAGGTAANGKMTWLTGARHKTNRYLLGSLDTKGDYQPDFTDIQAFLSYKINTYLSINVLGYYALNKYRFIPTDRETDFGTMSDVKRLKIYFAGQEEDKFETGMGAVKLNFTPSATNRYELMLSHYRAFEEETFDIAGAYWLQEIQGLDDAQAATNIGIGEYLQHARNDLFATVNTISVKGNHQFSENHSLNWGISLEEENFKDRINEWELIDSAGYSIPRNPDLELSYSRNADIELATRHIKTYVAHQTTLKPGWGNIRLNYGARLIYSDREEKLHLTPRFQVTIRPLTTPNTRFRLSGGWYFQPPFYKEYRPAQSGLINTIYAQKSRQILGGIDHYFNIFQRPFKFSSEAYYKHLYDLIPYQVDNVRLLYSGKNEATGYATGLDLKLHGEFVSGTESWATLSLLKTEEDLKTDTWNKPGEPGYIPRPSDQRLNFSLFFQDYLPNNPTFKVHLSLFYGTGLPFGPPRSPRYKATYRMAPYRRVDIGFSKDLKPWLNKNNSFPLIKDFWLGFEVFNLFDISNTISHYWVSDVENRQYAVPNYLTGRRINVSLNLGF